MSDAFSNLEREVEADLETRFVRAVQKRFPAARIRKGRWEGRRGAFDRVVMLPGPFIAFVELKNGKAGRLSGPQKEEFRELVGMGFLAMVVRNDEDIAGFVRALDWRVN
jgi:hypothetical protein